MPVSTEYLAFVLDQLSPLEGVSTRRMFGCVGIYLNGLMFALLDGENQLYFKATAANQGIFDAARCQRFTYLSKGKQVALNYYTLPSNTLEDRDELIALARLSQHP